MSDLLAPLGATFAMRLTMLSDWHVGLGAGMPGGVDRLVQRDHDDLPFVPAKTLNGIWRDACEVIAYGLDGRAPGGPWQRWVTWLFGSQPATTDRGPDYVAAIEVRAARLPSTLAQVLALRPAVARATTFVKPGVLIDPLTGRAEDDKLRFEEMARRGLILEARGGWQTDGLDEASQCAATAVLLLGARFVERLGGKRRRGAGHCELLIDGRADLDAALPWVEANDPPPPPRAWVRNRLSAEQPYPPRVEKGVGIADEGSTEGDGWIRVALRIRCLSPVVAHQRTVGNMVEGRPSVPGTDILAMVLGSIGADSRRLAAVAARRGELVATDATIEVDGDLSRPLDAAVYRALGGQLPKQVKQLHVGAVASDASGQWATPALEARTHNTIADADQRPTAAVGGVYTYLGITAGTVLRCEVRATATVVRQLGDGWWEAIEGRRRLGRSAKDGFGEVEVTASAPVDTLTTNGTDRADGTLVVWLQSDLLLLDERLRPSASPELLGRELGSLLGLPRPLTVVEAVGPEGLPSVSKTARRETWHRAWGLPRPTLAGLAAGSVVVFALGPGDAEALAARPEVFRRIEAGGLGERRAEGFGQVRFNPPELSHPNLRLEEAGDSGLGQATKRTFQHIRHADPSWELARSIETQAWRAEIARRATNLSADSERRVEALDLRAASAAQRGALRTMSARLDGTAAGLETFTAWREKLRATDVRKGNWPSRTVDALGHLVADPVAAYDALGFVASRRDALTITENGREALEEACRPEAIRSVLLAIAMGEASSRRGTPPGESD